MRDGDRAINLNQEMNFLKPVRVGDRLSSQVVIVDVMEKPIRLDPRAVWITIETQLTNQSDELVATIRNTVLFHREPDEVAADAGIEQGDDVVCSELLPDDRPPLEHGSLPRTEPVEAGGEQRLDRLG